MESVKPGTFVGEMSQKLTVILSGQCSFAYHGGDASPKTSTETGQVHARGR